MRLLSGAAIGGDDGELFLQSAANWSQVVAGEVLAEQLAELKDPQGKIKSNMDLGAELKTTLRPYQQIGVEWLYFLNRLGLGACLADDMGLGKTVQVIALFLLLQKEKAPHDNSKTDKVLKSDDLSQLFGIELDSSVADAPVKKSESSSRVLPKKEPVRKKNGIKKKIKPKKHPHF